MRWLYPLYSPVNPPPAGVVDTWKTRLIHFTTTPQFWVIVVSMIGAFLVRKLWKILPEMVKVILGIAFGIWITTLAATGYFKH